MSKQSNCDNCNGLSGQQNNNNNGLTTQLKELRLLKEAHEHIETLSIALKEEEKRRVECEQRAAKITEKASLCIQLNRQFKVNYEFKIERLTNINGMLPK